MNLAAYPRTIQHILSLDRRYIVPRFQREYSWEESEHETFWKDICSQLKMTGSSIDYSDYFIGALVLVGDETQDTEFQIVDGQQRLTTISILFSALTKKFIDLKEEGIAKKCYTYVEGNDSDNKPFFKLVNENPKPFLQKRVQFVDFKTDTDNSTVVPTTFEEQNLLDAYNFYFKALSSESLKKTFGEQHDHLTLVKSIRDQLLKLKTILITVNSLEEAYTIFETLNAKGKDLLTIDLIKNKLFKVLDGDHPDDEAKTSWKELNKNLILRDKRVKPSSFLRHFWISKYEFVTESKIYESFTKKIEESEARYKEFLNDLVNVSVVYNKIANPLISDWRQQEEKDIYYSLIALKLFNVVQPRPFILALFDARDRKVVNVNQVRETLRDIEKFHFVFSAVSSSRASGLEGKYSTLSRALRNSTIKKDAKEILNKLKEYFTGKLPDYSTFEKKFNEIEFVNDKTSDKKLIQYLFFNLEKSKYETDEIIPYNLTLEHLFPQSQDSDCKGQIGNLLPLAREINSSVKDGSLDKKLPEFKKSELKLVKEFISVNSTKMNWTDENILTRTKEIADLSYNNVWKIEI